MSRYIGTAVSAGGWTGAGADPTGSGGALLAGREDGRGVGVGVGHVAGRGSAVGTARGGTEPGASRPGGKKGSGSPSNAHRRPNGEGVVDLAEQGADRGGGRLRGVGRGCCLVGRSVLTGKILGVFGGKTFGGFGG